MEIIINIDNNKFEEVVKKELDAFSKDELKELCRQGILQCLSNEETFQKLFIVKSDSYYNNCTANDVLKEAAKTINFDDLFNEVRDKIIEYVRNNQMDLVKDIVMQIFVNGLAQYMNNNINFTSYIHSAIYDITNNNH